MCGGVLVIVCLRCGCCPCVGLGEGSDTPRCGGSRGCPGGLPRAWGSPLCWCQGVHSSLPAEVAQLGCGVCAGGDGGPSPAPPWGGVSYLSMGHQAMLPLPLPAWAGLAVLSPSPSSAASCTEPGPALDTVSQHHQGLKPVYISSLNFLREECCFHHLNLLISPFFPKENP